MEEKALDKIDIASELKTLSPIEAKSLELKKEAEAAEITDKVSYVAAKKIKKALISHRTGTKDLRLTFTRKLDNLKDQFIKKQDEVLEASLAGEEIIKKKVADWEKLEADRKAAEEKRIAAIIEKLAAVPNDLDRKTSTPEDVKRVRAALKMERGLLDTSDRNRVAIKNITNEVNEKIDDIAEAIDVRIFQEKAAAALKEQEEQLAAERKQFEDEQAAVQQPASEELVKPVIAEGGTQVEVQTAHTEEDPFKGVVDVDMAAPEGDATVQTIQWRFESAEDLTDAELLTVGSKIVNGAKEGFITRSGSNGRS